jgi:hypothetical protein
VLIADKATISAHSPSQSSPSYPPARERIRECCCEDNL